jgi:phage-related protein
MAAMVVAIEALEATMQEAVNNSKILNALDNAIAKALGLLVDVILLPFLPLLTAGIIWLFKEIMEFRVFWMKIWNSQLVKDMATVFSKGLAALLNLMIDVPTALAQGTLKILEWLMGLAGGIINLLLTIPEIAIPEALRWLKDFLADPIKTITIDLGLIGQELLRTASNTIRNLQKSLGMSVGDEGIDEGTINKENKKYFGNTGSIGYSPTNNSYLTINNNGQELTVVSLEKVNRLQTARNP